MNVREYNEKYYKKNRENLVEKQRIYNQTNRLRINEKQREYNKRNREEIRKKQNDYLATEEGKRKSNEYYHRKKIEFDIKIKARNKLRYALKVGKIVKPEKCEKCFEKSKLHGHHENYCKPLEVIWVCNMCHKDIHKKGN